MYVVSILLALLLLTRRGLYSNHSITAEGIKESIPIQCVCTWNGAVVLRAAPFLGLFRFFHISSPFLRSFIRALPSQILLEASRSVG
jgi:hypothetical protein